MTTDYGEPWHASGGYSIYDIGHVSIASGYNDRTRERICACVNALAGVADPAAEIAALRTERDRLREALEPNYVFPTTRTRCMVDERDRPEAALAAADDEPEIIVSPAMLEAGASVLDECACFSGLRIQAEYVAKEVFHEMALARLTERDKSEAT